MAKIDLIEDLQKAIEGIDLDFLQGCNVLITGATGLIGGALSLALIKSDININIYLSSRNRKNLESQYIDYKSDFLHFLEIDVLRPPNLTIDFDYIIDCASLGNPAAFREQPVDIIMSNVGGVNNLLSYGKGHKIKRFLYVSSGEVYGEGDGRDFEESYSGYVDVSNVRSCYPLSKRAAENLCIAYSYQYDMDVVIARPCHTFGPNFTDSDDRAYAQFIRNVVNGDDIVLRSQGSQIRSWLYVADCVSAILYILKYGSSREAYNISSSELTVSIREFAEMIAHKAGKRVIFNIPEGTDKNAIISRGVLSPSKLYGLGWNPNFSFESAIEHTINIAKSKDIDK